MHKFRAALVGLLCLVAVGGCTTNNTIANTNFTTVATMQLAVGTINDSAGTLSAQCSGCGTGPFLDVITTFRNQLGNSAFLHPNNASLTPDGTASGSFGGLFSYGQFPGSNGLPATAPAWAAPGSGTGFDIDFNIGFIPLPISVPRSEAISTTILINGTSKTYSASATLVSLALLGSPAAPISFVSNGAGTGGGTLTIGPIVAGATEQVAVILGPGTPACPALPCSPIVPVETPPTPPAAEPNMFEVKGATTTIAIPNGTLAVPVPGSGQSPIPYEVFVIDADFGWVEAGATNAPTVGNPAPAITNGVNGQADLSVSGTTLIHSP